MTKASLEKYTRIFGKTEYAHSFQKEKEPPKLKKDDLQFKEIVYMVGSKWQNFSNQSDDRLREVHTAMSEKDEKLSRAESKGSAKKKIFSRRS